MCAISIEYLGACMCVCVCVCVRARACVCAYFIAPSFSCQPPTTSVKRRDRLPSKIKDWADEEGEVFAKVAMHVGGNEVLFDARRALEDTFDAANCRTTLNRGKHRTSLNPL